MIKLTFELYPEDGQIKPYEHPYGYIFRGVIMRWLKEAKPELVHQLHAYGEMRPYAINCIIHKKIAKVDFILVTSQDDLSDALVQDLLLHKKIFLRIGQKNYYFSKIKIERLDLRFFLEHVRPVKGFNINFVRPVYFNTSMGDYPVRFPIPTLLFGNLANIWNKISQDNCEIPRQDFVNWINTHLYVSGYNMKSVRVEIGKFKPVVGGLGNASYQVSKINKVYYKHYLEQLNKPNDYDFINQNYANNCCWLEILCKLGEYTNTGANRTAGMGVMRYYPKVYLSEKNFLQKN